MQDFCQGKRLFCPCAFLLWSCFIRCLHHLSYHVQHAHFLTSMQGTAFGVWDFTPKPKQSRFGHLSLIRFSFGLLVFTPTANPIWGLRLSKSYGGHHLRAIGFHPEKIINGVSVIRGWRKIFLRAIGFHSEVRNSLIWTFGCLMSNKRHSFGVTGFHLEDNYIWCLDYPRLMQDSPSA